MRALRLPEPLPFLRIVALIAVLTCAALVVSDWSSIVTMTFRDPDDAMRYVQVRDFLAGQNWFDVTQHRVNPPLGGPMHWSRLVDMPIAAIMLLFRPLVGSAAADIIALAVVPLLTLTALFLAFAVAARRICGPIQALLATALLALSLPILIQFHPLRVDHHGWQIVMAAITLWATFDPRAARGGLIAGIATAAWIHISSEGLPYVALFGGLYALAFARDAQTWPRLATYLPSVTLGAAVLLLVTRGWPQALAPYCDSVSPAYLLPMAAACVMLILAKYFIGAQMMVARLAIPALAAIAGIVTFLMCGGACLAGPFETLDPVVYRYWYLGVMEGRPVWEQSPITAAIIIVPPLAGLIGSAWAARLSANRADRDRWIATLLLLLGAFALSCLVMRALSVAHLFALPGTAWLIVWLLPKARGLSSSAARIVATAGLYILTPIGAATLITTVIPGPEDIVSGKAPVKDMTFACAARSNFTDIAALPPGIIMALFDIGPNFLAFTPHSVVATGHHRNVTGMRDVILTFTSKPDAARAIVLAHHSRYLAYCPNMGESDGYARRRPQALITQLKAGHVPAWLEPVPMRVGEAIRIYRVLPTAR